MWWLAVFGVAWSASPPLGQYALKTEVVTQSQIPVLGQNRVVTTTRALLTVSEQDGRVEALQLTCSVDVQSTSRTDTVIPEAFVAALPPVVYQVVSGLDGFHFASGVQRVGLEHPVGTLPRSANDPAVLDTDGDGHPGATVTLDNPWVGAVHIYVVQQTETVLSGRSTTDGALGQVEIVALTQRTLGASNPLFAVTPKLWPEAGESRFWMTALEPGATCADLSET